ncbi:MAG: hypothetical protein RR500_05750 [Bacilli bacterium]
MICNKCNKQTFIKNFEDINTDNKYFCTNCGSELIPNRCTNPNCKEISFSLLDEDTEQRKANDDDCYCLFCGFETTYFKDGLITPKNSN